MAKRKVSKSRKQKPSALNRWWHDFRGQLRDEQRQELAGLLLLTLAGLLFYALFSQKNSDFSLFLQQSLRFLMGRGAILVPVLLAIWGLAGLLRIPRHFTLPRRAGFLLAALVAAGFLHLEVPLEATWSVEGQRAGGGLAGAAVTAALARPFGPVGRSLILAAGTLAAVILIFDFSLAALARSFFARLKAGFAPAAGTGTARKRPAVKSVSVLEDGEDLESESGAGVVLEEFHGEAFPDGEAPTVGEESALPDRAAPAAEAADAVTAADGAIAAEAVPSGAAAGPVAVPRSNAGTDRTGQGPFEPQTLLGPESLYRLPPVTLLSRRAAAGGGQARDAQHKRKVLEETLRSFGIEAKVVDVQQGPTVTRFEVQPGPGVKVSRIANLADDIALSMAAPGVRIVAPIPGKAAMGIEVPNTEIATVYLRDVLESREFQQSASRLTLALGQDISGRSVVYTLEKMVHLLIAGATGSGKSVCVNGLLCSLLFKATPAELRLMLIDPKVVELSAYNGIPHLLTPVVTDPKKAAGCLRWVIKEMERRYERFAETGVRDISRYNQVAASRDETTLPYIVVVIDELADLMLVAPSEVEDAIQRLAQMARAAGIHLIVATQRPSVDVITGVIKANIPSRIAFAVSSQVDSRTILDTGGAEKLMGKGDMLFHPMGAAKPLRVQGAYIPESELENLLDFVCRQGQPEYSEEAMAAEAVEGSGGGGAWEDDLLPEAVRVILETGQASVSIVQRRLRVGYTRAGRLIDMMEERGIIGPHQGPKPREVLISHEAYHRMFEGGD